MLHNELGHCCQAAVVLSSGCRLQAIVVRPLLSGSCCQAFVLSQAVIARLLSKRRLHPGLHYQVIIRPLSLSGGHRQAVFVKTLSSARPSLPDCWLPSRHRQAIVIVRLSSSGSCCCHVVSSCLLCSSSLKNTMLAVIGKVSFVLFL